MATALLVPVTFFMPPFPRSHRSDGDRDGDFRRRYPELPAAHAVTPASAAYTDEAMLYEEVKGCSPGRAVVLVIAGFRRGTIRRTRARLVAPILVVEYAARLLDFARSVHRARQSAEGIVRCFWPPGRHGGLDTPGAFRLQPSATPSCRRAHADSDPDVMFAVGIFLTSPRRRPWEMAQASRQRISRMCIAKRYPLQTLAAAFALDRRAAGAAPTSRH